MARCVCAAGFTGNDCSFGIKDVKKSLVYESEIKRGSAMLIRLENLTEPRIQMKINLKVGKVDLYTIFQNEKL